MVMNHVIRILCGLSLTGAGIAAALADDMEKTIAHARSAAPVSVSADATIVIDGEVAVEGSNGWTCMPDLMPNDGAPVCIDGTWSKMLAAVGAKAEFTPEAIGISYMLMGDPPGGGVSNSDPYHSDHSSADDYVETPAHLMVIVPKAMMESMTTDPSSGGPYVMWKDTPYAHVMIPVDRSK